MSWFIEKWDDLQDYGKQQLRQAKKKAGTQEEKKYYSDLISSASKNQREMKKSFAYLEGLSPKQDPDLNTGIPKGTLDNPGGYNPLSVPVQGNAGAIPTPPDSSFVDNRTGDPAGGNFAIPQVNFDPARYGVSTAMIALVVGAFVIYSIAGGKKKKKKSE